MLRQEVLMDIISLQFEEPLTIHIGNTAVKILAFKTQEHGNIKFGVDAPRSVNVHREEIFHAIKQKKLLDTVE
jgi:carbon storage regulator